MADVFLSYSREDQARAAQIAQGLESAGIDVFWDIEIPPGQAWADYIEAKLAQCKALIVLWSAHSTKSQWVREEARMGRDKGVLIPVVVDGATPPFGFGEVQAADLSSWNGEPDHAGWRRFLDAVRHFASRAPAPAPQAAPRAAAPAAAHTSTPAEPKKKGGVPVWVWIAGAVVATIVVLGVIGAMLPEEPQQSAGGTQPVQPAMQQQQPPGAQVNYQQQVMERIAQAGQAYAAQGFQYVGQPVSGQLPAGQYMNYPVTLNAGAEYHIVGVCDSDCGDLDLLLYDENNNLISQDQLTDATPVVNVAPSWTGPFTVQVVMANCAVQPCYYALALFGR